ncbi:MAG TPA: glycoside hydrolase family 2 TIM barrel-domain containing protein, partial [Polyangiaceae bacterium]|nr:glycoside hydrolase family 2 TIM barrel-domain containing protein [Polyangiaceae bacterium]
MIAIAWLVAFPAFAQRRVENFNRDWKFSKGAVPGAERPGFDDRSWLSVRLPHDWAIAGPYDHRENPHTGKLPWRGEGWYRKRFTLPATDAGKRVVLDFDGVMAMPVVYVNGKQAGGWDYGYMSFRVDATEFVNFGTKDNVVAVHVDTSRHESRWYPGAGIYRKVELAALDPVHIARYGTFVTTPKVSDKEATVRVRTTVENFETRPVPIEIATLLLDDTTGAVRGTATSPVGLPARSSFEIEQTIVVKNPARWDIDSPRRHIAISRIFAGKRLRDATETYFGIREFVFTADDGFHLNGRRVQLKGVNLHHDQGPLGAAFFPRAMERQLEIMKDMGVNAIRTSHNPPAPEMLDLCDRMGFVVWNEAFDKWDGTATLPPGRSIKDHGRKQLDVFVRRDRNHPSVVAWSVGNEIWDLENGKLPNPPELLRAMVGFVKALDTTRPVTLAHAVPGSADTPLDDSLDIGGWNYVRKYQNSRQKRPKLPLVYSESASAYSTRGFYDFPQPTRKDDYSLALRISSYDRNAAYYSDVADTEFALMERDRFVAGEFVWTGFDYLGEPVPFVAEGWAHFEPRRITKGEEGRSSSFGIVDLVGIPKDRYYLYRSHWAPEKTTIHVVPHWTFPERVGRNVPVYVYTNGDSAELFVNGKSLGKKTKQPAAENVLDRYRLRWEDVVYEPGVVRV